jgi:type VI secretion system protein ImpL
MKRTIWSGAGGVFTGFLLMAWLAPGVLAVQGTAAWVLRLALTILGIAAAWLVYLYLSRRARALAAAGMLDTDDEVDTALATARARLLAAGTTGKGRLARLPVVIVLGPGGSTKTTVIAHSGLDPELLAGEVYRGDQIAPTSAINLWYAQGTVFLEAGHPVGMDERRWRRLVRRLQPSRRNAILGRAGQAPRVAMVCVSCDEFLRPGNSESLPALAKRLRAQLLELSGQLGVRLPVYVLFTRADRLPYFSDFVRNLTTEEVREVLGTTLPAPDRGAAGAWAERESARLRAAFQGLTRSLRLRRTELLAREERVEIRSAAYEFPRELQKISDLATQFLIDLGRPSQLGTSPFLRGFYFTGVRPIVVQDGGTHGLSPQSTNPIATPAAGATAIFNIQQLREAAHATVTPGARERKVPQWVFLNRIFREIVLADRAALGATAGGTRVNLWRRGLLAVATATLLILAFATTRSYLANRQLMVTAREAIEAARTIDLTGAATPTPELLRQLEPLRESAATLRGYENTGRPWRFGVGLYTGTRLLPELSRLYFDRFDPILWQHTHAGITATLTGLPELPNETSDYQDSYDALKAYLITTSHPRESTEDFLTPVLLAYWPYASSAQGEQLELARRHFAFFAGELQAAGNPYGLRPDPRLVERTRHFLHRFASVEPVYRALLAEVGRSTEQVSFARHFPESADALHAGTIIPGAFTRRGWTAIQNELANVDHLFKREEWVLGEQATPAAERARLAEELKLRYNADYLRYWGALLDSARVPPFNGAGDGARKLARLSGNQSPLLQLLALVSEHTDLDSAGIGKAFAPVQGIVPPGVTERYVGDGNKAYMAALGALQADLDQLASATGTERGEALASAGSSAKRVETEVQQLAREFSIEGDARAIGRAVERLLTQPADRAAALVRGAPVAALNTAGAAFCQTLQPLASRYPFNPSAGTEATPAEVAAVFQRTGSAIATLYENALQEIVVRQGSQYVARPGAEPRPAPAFLSFFNRVAAISTALYRDDGAEREIAFVLRPQTSAEITEVTIAILGQNQRSTRTFAAAAPFTWKVGATGGARVTANIGGSQVVVAETQPGPWAVFQLFRSARWERLGNDRYQVRWPIPGHAQPLTMELDFGGGPPLFMESYLGGMNCVRQITR